MLNLTPSHLVRLAVIAISAIGTPCLVVCAEPTAPAESNLEFDSGTKGWQTVLDGVMGGRSTGRISAGEGGTLQFTGELSLENNGGFSQIRTEIPEGLFADSKGLLMRVKGDGRTYQCDIRSSRARVMAGGYQRVFETKAGEWIEVEIPFDEYAKNNRDCQFDWIKKNKEELGVDFVGKTENLQEDFNKVCDSIGIDKFELSHRNKSQRADYQDYYNEESFGSIYSMKDISNMGIIQHLPENIKNKFNINFIRIGKFNHVNGLVICHFF